jgi:hypothetical protein
MVLIDSFWIVIIILVGGSNRTLKWCKARRECLLHFQVQMLQGERGKIKKFTFKVTQYIYLRPAAGRDGYRLYNETIKHIISNRDVIQTKLFTIFCMSLNHLLLCEEICELIFCLGVYKYDCTFILVNEIQV